MKDMSAIFMDIYAVDIFGVHVSSDMRTLIYNQTTFTCLR